MARPLKLSEPCSLTTSAPMLFLASHTSKTAPSGSAITAMRPASITSNGGMITEPPAASALGRRVVGARDGDVGVPRRLGRRAVGDRADGGDRTTADQRHEVVRARSRRASRPRTPSRTARRRRRVRPAGRAGWCRPSSGRRGCSGHGRASSHLSRRGVGSCSRRRRSPSATRRRRRPPAHERRHRAVLVDEAPHLAIELPVLGRDAAEEAVGRGLQHVQLGRDSPPRSSRCMRTVSERSTSRVPRRQ